MAYLRNSRIIPIALVVVIIVIAIAALVSLARIIFFSGGSSTPVELDNSRTVLLDTAADHSVTMTIRGPIVADEEFHSAKITVTPGSRQLVTYRGYLESPVETVNLSNNVASYEEFVYALDKADLPKGRAFVGERDDTRGVCATGFVYEFAIIDGSDTVKRLWTSTCNGSRGSLNANVRQLMQLFVNQIPDADKAIRRVSL